MSNGLGARVYNIFFKRSSTYFLTLIAGVFIFERGTDGIADRIFNSINQGKQWRDIKNNYAAKAVEE